MMPSELSITYILIWVIVTATAVGQEQYPDYANEKISDYGNYPSDYDASPDDHINTPDYNYYDEKIKPPRFHMPRPSHNYKNEDDTDKQQYPAEKFQNAIRNHRISNRKSPNSFDYNSEDNDPTLVRSERSKFRLRNKERDFDNDEPKRHSSRYDRYNNKNDGYKAEEDFQDDTKLDLHKENHNDNNERKTTTETVIHRKPRAKYLKYRTNDDNELYTPSLPDSFDDDLTKTPRTTILAKERRDIFEDSVLRDTARKRKYYKEYEDYYDLKRIQRLKQKLAAQKDDGTFTPIEPMLSFRSSTMTTANWLMPRNQMKRIDLKRIKKTERVTIPNNDMFMEYVDNFDNPKKPDHKIETINSKKAKMLSRLINPKGKPQKKQKGKGPQLRLNNETEDIYDYDQFSIIDRKKYMGRDYLYHIQEVSEEHIEKNASSSYRSYPYDTNTIININNDNKDTVTSRAKGKSESEESIGENETKITEAWTKSESNISLSPTNSIVTSKVIAKSTKRSTIITSTIGENINKHNQATNRSTSEEQSTMMSFTEKSNLLIQNEVKTKEMLKVLATKKPTISMQMMNKSYTIAMVEPTTSRKLDYVREIYNDVSPEQLQKIKRIMRYKILSNIKRLQDLNENGDEMVCDYIDMSLLNVISAGIVGRASVLMLILSFFVTRSL